MTDQDIAAHAPSIDRTERLPRQEPSLGADTHEVIGELLRRMYEDLLNRPVPGRFLEILERLDRGSSQGGSEERR